MVVVKLSLNSGQERFKNRLNINLGTFFYIKHWKKGIKHLLSFFSFFFFFFYFIILYILYIYIIFIIIIIIIRNFKVSLRELKGNFNGTFIYQIR